MRKDLVRTPLRNSNGKIKDGRKGWSKDVVAGIALSFFFLLVYVGNLLFLSRSSNGRSFRLCVGEHLFESACHFMRETLAKLALLPYEVVCKCLALAVSSLPSSKDVNYMFNTDRL
jgi:hypothetical protein